MIFVRYCAKKTVEMFSVLTITIIFEKQNKKQKMCFYVCICHCLNGCLNAYYSAYIQFIRCLITAKCVYIELTSKWMKIVISLSVFYQISIQLHWRYVITKHSLYYGIRPKYEETSDISTQFARFVRVT